MYQFLQNGELQLGEQIYSVNADWNLVPNTISRLSHEGDVQRLEYTNISVGVGFSGGPVFDQYGNVIAMHDALSADGANYAIAIKIDSALQTLQALDYAVPKAIPFYMPSLNGGAGATQSAPTSSTTSTSSMASEMQLYTNAMLSRDSNAMEAAAGKISNPTFATLLRSRRRCSETRPEQRLPVKVKFSRHLTNSKRKNMRIQAKAYSGRGNYLKAFPLYRCQMPD